MMNCLTCGKELVRALQSAKKENGDSYVMCSSCGYVHLLTTTNGLPDLQRTKEGSYATEQMLEAKRLFEENNLTINAFKTTIHGDIKSTIELEEIENENGDDCMERILNSLRPEDRNEFLKTTEQMRELGLALGMSKDEVEASIKKAAKSALEAYQNTSKAEELERDLAKVRETIQNHPVGKIISAIIDATNNCELKVSEDDDCTEECDNCLGCYDDDDCSGCSYEDCDECSEDCDECPCDECDADEIFEDDNDNDLAVQLYNKEYVVFKKSSFAFLSKEDAIAEFEKDPSIKIFKLSEVTPKKTYTL